MHTTQQLCTVRLYPVLCCLWRCDLDKALNVNLHSLTQVHCLNLEKYLYLPLSLNADDKTELFWIRQNRTGLRLLLSKFDLINPKLFGSNPGPDPGFAKRGGRVSKLRENCLIWPQNRLNLHDLIVKKRGAGAKSAHSPTPGSAPVIYVLFILSILIHNFR